MRFLEKVVKDSLDHFDDLHDVIFVLPGRRTGTFLKKYILELDPRTQWSPEIIGFNEVAKKNVNLEVMDAITLHFELYKAYNQVKPDAEDFAQFESWANIILSDFNAVDNYLVDASKAYSDLSNIKEIDEWSFNLDPLSDHQKEFLGFWDVLGKLYKQFRKNLLAQRMAYPGMLMRYIAENIETVLPKEEPLNFCFAGFNALSRAEIKIIEYCQKFHQTRLYWDVDGFYHHRDYHPAGHFTRRLMKRLGSSLNVIEDKIDNKNKTVSIISVSSPLGQCRMMGDLLDSTDVDTNVAIILADESLLEPCLESLPQGISKVNITMGMGYVYSALYKIFDAVLQMHRYADRMKNSIGQYVFYHQDFANCLREIASHDSAIISNELVEEILKKLSNENKLNLGKSYFSQDEIKASLAPISGLFQNDKSDINSLIQAFVDFCHLLVSNGNINLFNRDIAIQFEKMLVRILELSNHYGYLDKLSSFQKIFRQLASTEKLSFIGEPLGGVQIMGMLETRAIDFDKVILLGANEGQLPGSKKPNSFFPYELKNYYGIPNYKDHDALYAYYFYRLLQHPGEVSILYSMQKDDFGGGGEKSRFISQLLYEKLRGQLKIELFDTNAKAKISPESKSEVEIDNDENIATQLIALWRKNGLSPSALEKYMSCPLDFYYRYVLRLKEEEELSDDINNAVMGTCIHDALENLYTPFVGKGAMHENDLKKISAQVKSAVQLEFSKANLKEATSSGPNHLVYLMSEKMVQRVVDWDMKRIKNGDKIEILVLEKDMKAPFFLTEEKNSEPIFLRGKADRIEKLNGSIHIIDYKSGRVDVKDVTLSKEDDFKKKSKAFQLAFYIWLYAQDQSYGGENIEASILSLPKYADNLVKLKHHGLSKNDIGQLIVSFEKMIRETIGDLLDSEAIFKHDKRATFCSFCPVEEKVF